MARRRSSTELVKADADTEPLVPQAGGIEIFEGAGIEQPGTEIVQGPGGPPVERPEDVLAQPPDARDISAELAAPPRRRLPWLTLALSACVVAAAAFSGGALVEKNHLHGTSGSRAGGFAAAVGGTSRTGTGTSGRTFGGFGGYGGAGSAGTGAGAGTGTGTGGGTAGAGGGTAAAGLTVGTVKLVDGSTIYVTDAQGDIVKVTTGASTTVTEAKKGKVSDLQPGQSVTVRGTQGAGGDIAATTVTQGAATAGGFGGFGGAGAARGGN